MKLITKLAVLATLLALVTGAVAQGGGGGGQGRGMRFQPTPTMILRSKDVQTDLKLTDDQTKKLTDIQAKQQEEMQSMFQNAQSSGTPPDPAAMKKISDSYKAQYEAVLTPEQNKRLKEIFIQWRKNQAILDPDVQAALGITADQKAKIDDLASNFQKANAELGQKIRNNEITREDATPIRDKNNATYEEDLGKVLTPDQASKLKEMGGAPFTGKIQMGGGRRGGGGG